MFSSDPDSSSDSYTLLTPPPNEPPVSPLSTETLGGAEFTQDEPLHLQNGEELRPEGEESDQYPRSGDLRKQAGMNKTKDCSIDTTTSKVL